MLTDGGYESSSAKKFGSRNRTRLSALAWSCIYDCSENRIVGTAFAGKSEEAAADDVGTPKYAQFFCIGALQIGEREGA
jgi:hypothetical protein